MLKANVGNIGNIDMLTFMTCIAKLKQEKEERGIEHDTPELRFFRNCPYFLTGKCSSINWGPESPCQKCFKEGSYNLNNSPKDVETILLKMKDEKCR